MAGEHSESDANASDKTRGQVIAAIYEEMDELGGTFGAVAGVSVFVFLMQLVLDYSSRVHWLLAAVLSAAFLSLVAWFIRKIMVPPLASTRGIGAVYLILGLMSAVVLAGWVSLTLHTLGLGRYEITSASSLNAFMQLYFYTFADLIPALKITDTLHISSPIETLDFAAGVPVLAFRIYVLWFVFDAFRNWRKSRKDAGKEKQSDIIMYLTFLLIFVFVILGNLQ
jgi:hypothetical protein